MTNLYGNGRFDVYCTEAEWVGAGRYHHSSDSLRLDFDVLTRRGRKVLRPAPLEMQMVGRGNELDLRWREVELVWRRRV